MDYYISVVLIAIAAVLNVTASLPVLKILQLSGYRSSGIIGFWRSTKHEGLIRYVALTIIGAIAIAITVGCFNSFEYARYCAVVVFVLFQTVFVVATRGQGECDVKYTPRMGRLIATETVLTLILSAGAAWAAYYDTFCQIVITAIGILTPFIVMAANTLMMPIENAVHKRYIKKAQNKLISAAPIVIGITGSFGKTTAKNILTAMLKDKYAVLATPGNFNTPMGICKTINDELNSEQVFIAEMGARYKGDVKELCDIVKPKYGIITAVGDMHLSTLGSRQGVADTKFELAQGLDADGFVAFNGYNEDCARLFDRDTMCKKELTGEGCRIYYSDLKVSREGARFNLHIDGETTEVCTKLLGAHIPEMVCVCAAIALELGVDIKTIAVAASNMPAVEHRLQLLADGDVTVIDDAYNSNPVGASNAIEVLSAFDGVRVIITPGFVELGSIEKQCNIRLGEQIAARCDYAYLVGSRGADIKRGAVDAGMSEDNIKLFDHRNDAVSALKYISGKKTVLFENDLPDNVV